MHIVSEDGKKEHVFLSRRYRPKQGFVRYREDLFWIDPKAMYRESWPHPFIPLQKIGVLGIDFMMGTYIPVYPPGSVNATGIALKSSGVPQAKVESVRSSEALEAWLECRRMESVFKGTKMDPMVIIILISLMVNVLLGAMAFLK